MMTTIKMTTRKQTKKQILVNLLVIALASVIVAHASSMPEPATPTTDSQRAVVDQTAKIEQPVVGKSEKPQEASQVKAAPEPAQVAKDPSQSEAAVDRRAHV